MGLPPIKHAADTFALSAVCTLESWLLNANITAHASWFRRCDRGMTIAMQIPLATYLTHAATSGSHPIEQQESAVPPACSSVILTILNQANRAVSEADLAAQSELRPDWFRGAVRDLLVDGLIEGTSSGYEITSRGRHAASEARSRLLSLK